MVKLAVLLGVVAGASLWPVVTLHALLLHFTDMEHGGLERWIGDPGLVGAVLLTLVSSASSVAVVVAIVQWRVQAARLAGFARGTATRRVLGIPVAVVPGSEVILFAAGTRRSRIFVSEGALQALSPALLKAALLHEQAHVERHDVAWRSSLAVIEKAFGRLPGVGSCVRTLALRAECAADERAIAMGADRKALFDAIVAAAAVPQPLPALSGVAVLPRLERLANADATLPRVPVFGPAVVAAWLLTPPVLAHVVIVAGVACASLL